MDEPISDVELWKAKKLVNMLKSVRGSGTSVVSIVLKPGEKISDMNSKLAEELGTAVNIKSRVNRQSVQSAITSAQNKLKLYKETPKNGLVIFSGEVLDNDGKERKLVIDIEPIKPVNTTLYRCDNRFRTECLEELLEDDKHYAFAVIDGNGFLLATLAGNCLNILYDIDVSLPSKTRRGGQSAARISRLREEAFHVHIMKCCEKMKANLIKNDKVPFEGIIIAGSADVKNDFAQSPMLDPRIKKKIIDVVDVSYGGKSGLQHAINQTKNLIGNLKFNKEKQLLESYFEHIAKDTGLISYGVEDTLMALENGAVEKLIIYEDLELKCKVLRIKNGDEDDIENENIKNDGEKEQDLLDWLVENKNSFGADLAFISDKTPEGTQFIKGFSGVGALLRYKMDFATLKGYEDDDWEESSDC